MEYFKHEFIIIAYLREWGYTRVPFDIFFAESEEDIERVVKLIEHRNFMYTHHQVFKSL